MVSLLSRRSLLLIFAGVGASLVAGALGLFGIRQPAGSRMGDLLSGELIALTEPTKSGSLSVEEAIARRRSRRTYADEPVLLTEISQLCWAAQGVTEPGSGLRAAPSAGGIYPIEVFVVVGRSDLQAGVYHYSPREHSLERIKTGDYRKELREAALDQEWVGNGAVDFVITAVPDRTAEKYGDRGRDRYVQMEAGHVAQNIYLQAQSLGLGTVSVGAFHDDQVREVISAPNAFVPLYVMPIGRRA